MTSKSLYRNLSAIAIIAAITCSCTTREHDYSSLVDTRVGTESRFELSYGNTYPATGRPFAMHLWSPQTGQNGDGWKYTWQAEEIRGFCQSHQCSPWTRDYALFSLFPETGQLSVLARERGAAFSHEDEIATPNYYSVSFKNGIKTEMSPTPRCNHMRFSFPDNGPAYIVLDGDVRMCNITIDPEGNSIRGCLEGGRGRGLKNWFVIRFNKEFSSYGTWTDQRPWRPVRQDNQSILAAAEAESEELLPDIKAGETAVSGRLVGAYLEFPAGSTVQVRSASSYISQEQAELNLERELGSHGTLEDTRAEGQKVWNDALGQIAVEGGSEEDIKTFYTNFYHASLFPREFFEIDKDGNPVYFSPFDSKVHEGYMYTDIGYWDAFRSQFPLYNLIHPEMQGRYMKAIMDIYDQMGWLPSWPFPGETNGMIGNHAISLLADAWVKGIRTFDPAQAVEAYAHEATAPMEFKHGRKGGQYYDTIGYVPYPEVFSGTAMTLEYAYDDFCGWLMAKEAGNGELIDRFGGSMYNYRNVFDPGVGFMNGRDAKGEWVKDFRPEAWGGPYIEGNAWHYNWSVFQDVQGLINLYGSDEEFTRRLDQVFSTPAIIDLGFYGDIFNEMVEMVVAGLGQYEHGNQPIHHMAYLYDYAGQPWKTQYWTRKIMDKLYNSGPKGYPGDEDQGSMSSWYVISALGLYPVTPGTSQYAIGSPLFEKATIKLENGNTFVIEAENNSKENVYIQSATLNGRPFERNWIDHSEIVNGGTLHFMMGPEPATDRCTDKDAAPFSLSKPL